MDKEQTNTYKEDEKKGIRSAFEILEEVAIAVIIVVAIFAFFFRIVTVNGESMEPNYIQNDKLIISSMFFNVEKGDVVVISGVLEDPIIKRVIATEGDIVDIDNETGYVYVNGKKLDESFYTQNGVTVQKNNGTEFPLQVEEGCIFVLGDNRIVSKDSRSAEIGQVSMENVLGKAVLKIIPFENGGKII